MTKPRQLRFQVTGGIGDVEAAMEVLRDLYGEDWMVTFEEVKRFGEVGPLHKGVIGFVESLKTCKGFNPTPPSFRQP